MKYRVVAKVIVVNSDGQILLLRRSETDVRRPLQWDIPGGHTDENELAEQAAVRETNEESGIQLQTQDLQLVYAVSEKVEDDLNVTWLFYIAHAAKPEVSISAEHSDYAWKTLDEVIESVEYDRQKKVFEYVRNNNLLNAT